MTKRKVYLLIIVSLSLHSLSGLSEKSIVHASFTQAVPTTSDIIMEAIANEITNVGPKPIGNLFFTDINSDGLIDVVGRTFAEPYIRYVYGNPVAVAGVPNFDSTVEGLGNMTMFDIDADQDKDVLALDSRQKYLHVFFNNFGVFNSGPNPDIMLNLNCAGTPLDLVALDIQDDGIPDYLMVLVNDETSSLGQIKFYTLPNLLFLGDLNFAGRPVAIYDVPLQFIPGLLPIAMVILDDSTLLYFDALLGLIPFDLGLIIPTDYLVHIDFLDFDNDGFMDFFARNSTYFTDPNGFFIKADEIRLFKNMLGSGGLFQVIQQTTLPANSQWVVPGDYDGDGDNDIIVSTFNPTYSFSVLHNNSGIFTAPVSIPANIALPAIASAGSIRLNSLTISNALMGIGVSNEMDIDTPFSNKLNTMITDLVSAAAQLNVNGFIPEATTILVGMKGIQTQLSQGDMKKADITGAQAFTRLWTSSITFDNSIVNANINSAAGKARVARVMIHEGLLAAKIENYFDHDNIADRIIPALKALSGLSGWSVKELNQQKWDEKMEQILNRGYDAIISRSELYGNCPGFWNTLFPSTATVINGPFGLKALLNIQAPDDVKLVGPVGTPMCPHLAPFFEGMATYTLSLIYCGNNQTFAISYPKQ